MLPTAQRMAELLDGIVLDEERNALGRQRIAHIRDELCAYDRQREAPPDFECGRDERGEFEQRLAITQRRERSEYRFRVLNADSRRIHLLRLTPISR